MKTSGEKCLNYTFSRSHISTNEFHNPSVYQTIEDNLVLDSCHRRAWALKKKRSNPSRTLKWKQNCKNGRALTGSNQAIAKAGFDPASSGL